MEKLGLHNVVIVKFRSTTYPATIILHEKSRFDFTRTGTISTIDKHTYIDALAYTLVLKQINIRQAVREAATIYPRPLQVDL